MQELSVDALFILPIRQKFAAWVFICQSLLFSNPFRGFSLLIKRLFKTARIPFIAKKILPNRMKKGLKLVWKVVRFNPNSLIKINP
jgi:hypothetical protein